MDLTPGSVVAGRYRADRKVGAGGMGEVWAAEHLSIGVKVALKTLLGAAAKHHEVVARFNREAFLLGRVRSDHVSRVLDFVDDETWGLVIVMEFVEGESLADRLDSRTMSVEDTVELAIDLTTALCDLHRASIVHRDLKPGNVIMQPRPDGKVRSVVVDFGISRMLSEGKSGDEDTITGITKVNMALGTVEYMAPEQILNSRDVTAVSDIYALGAILYRALKGGHAYGQREEDALARAKLVDDPPPLELKRQDRIACELSKIVMKAMQRRPVNRYGSAQEMMAELLPLRDLIKISELELDATTTADGNEALEGLIGRLQPMLEPDPPSLPGRESLVSSSDWTSGDDAPASRESFASMPEPAHAHSVPSGGAAHPPRTRGVSKGIFATAIAAAFAVGAAAAVAFMPGGPVSSLSLVGSRGASPESEPTTVASTEPEALAAAEGDGVPGADPGGDRAAPEREGDAETIDLDAEASAPAALAVAAPRPAAPPPAAPPAAPPPRPRPPPPRPRPPPPPPPKPAAVDSPPDIPTAVPSTTSTEPTPNMPEKVERPTPVPTPAGGDSPSGAEAASP